VRRLALLSPLLAPFLLAGAPAPPPPLPDIRVAPGGHQLATADGRPFLWLGDTAWELIHRTTREEAAYYLRERARQGFTVVQTVVLAEFDGLRKPTPEGLLPFENADPARPNPAYFDKVAFIVDEAARQGLYVALLPTWGDKLTAPWGDGPRIFTPDHPEVARGYGRYLGERLRGRTNIVWMLGGDRPPLLNPPGGAWFAANARAAGLPETTDFTPVWAAMAQGLREGMGAPIVTGYHPQGGELSTAVLLPDAPWLSINGMQSGHGGGHDVPVWQWVARDYALPRPKPTIDLEPNYEDHPYNMWPAWDPATGYFRDHDVRKQIWRGVLAGSAGATYGNGAVWQFASVRDPLMAFAERDWVAALHRPGAEQLHYLRDLLFSRPFADRVPDPALIVDNPEDGARHMVGARDARGRYAFVYVPTADQPVTIDLARLPARRVRLWWYDPRSGFARPAGEQAGGGPARLMSPSHGPDWVLVIDDAAAGFGTPGLAAVNQ
jgi:hypothetical protein